MIRKWLRRRRMPPDCREVADVLQAYLDGELPPDQTHLVAEHVEHCQRCGIDAEIYREVKRSLARLAIPADPDAIHRLRSYVEELTDDAQA